MRLSGGEYIEDTDSRRIAKIAALFCEMSSDKQAEFFNQVAQQSKLWPAPSVFQWRDMERDLTPEASDLIKDLYEHTR